MSCSHYDDRIALHAGGDLDAASAEAVEAHAASCPACAQLLEELRHLRADLVVLYSQERASTDELELRRMRQTVLDQVEELGEIGRGPQLAGWRAAAAIAVLALASLLAVAIGRQSPAPSTVAERPDTAISRSVVDRAAAGTLQPPPPASSDERHAGVADISQGTREEEEAPTIRRAPQGAPTSMARKASPPATSPTRPPGASQTAAVPASPSAGEPAPVVVKLLPNDPQLVIYWILYSTTDPDLRSVKEINDAKRDSPSV